MSKHFTKHIITLSKDGKETDIYVHLDRITSMISTHCDISTDDKVYKSIEKQEFFNYIHNHVKSGYSIYDWDDIIPYRYKV